jgi:hypothetical protein
MMFYLRLLYGWIVCLNRGYHRIPEWETYQSGKRAGVCETCLRFLYENEVEAWHGKH